MQSADGEAKKEGVRSMLFSLHADLARICVAGRDGVDAALRKNLKKAEHVVFQQANSLATFYVIVPAGSGWVFALEMGKANIPVSWNDGRHSGFIEDDMDLLYFVWKLHDQQARSLHMLMQQEGVADNNGWNNSVLDTPNAKRLISNTKSVKRQTNLIHDAK
ncbi:hypothetical protein DFS34DRAFT_623546 [Phlyctochytrium arcticum]|nr:hypothetical protein DFS34DRAFT_623546 [Phlyctochytrium arcticum]